MVRFDARSIRAWIAVALWLGVILMTSGDGFSARSTGRFLAPLIEFLWPSLSRQDLIELHYLIRKLAHVVQYGVLGLLVLRALRRSRVASLVAAAVWTVGLVALVAFADETRQSLSSARTGSPIDVALDISGCVLAVALGLWWIQVRRTRGAHG